MPKQGGSWRQAQLLTKTQIVAANSVSSGMSGLPPPYGRILEGGISGFAISHSPSGTMQHTYPAP